MAYLFARMLYDTMRSTAPVDEWDTALNARWLDVILLLKYPLLENMCLD